MFLPLLPQSLLFYPMKTRIKVNCAQEKQITQNSTSDSSVGGEGGGEWDIAGELGVGVVE